MKRLPLDLRFPTFHGSPSTRPVSIRVPSAMTEAPPPTAPRPARRDHASRIPAGPSPGGACRPPWLTETGREFVDPVPSQRWFGLPGARQHPPLLHGFCKIRSSRLSRFPDEVSALSNKGVCHDGDARPVRGNRWEPHDISERLRAVGGWRRSAVRWARVSWGGFHEWGTYSRLRPRHRAQQADCYRGPWKLLPMSVESVTHVRG
jgi:hypothetical protein